MLNASVGVQRALDRLRPATGHPSVLAQSIHHQSLVLARAVRSLVRPERIHDAADGPSRTAAHVVPGGRAASAGIAPHMQLFPSVHADRTRRSGARGGLTPRSAQAGGVRVVAPARLARRSLISRIGPERAVPIAAVAIVFIATAISSAPALSQSGPTGGTSGSGHEARLAAGGFETGAGGFETAAGDVESAVGGSNATIDDSAPIGLGIISGNPEQRYSGSGDATQTASRAGTLDDGTLLKPVAVDTSVSDGKGLMRSYRVRPGDTLTGIARKFGVTMMTVWWANHLKAKDDLHIGQTLTIPPVSGLVVTVGSSDTLETLAAKYRVEPSEIVDANELDDPNLVIGQTLTIPGALGAGIAAPPPPKPKATKSSGGSSGGTVRPPSRYTGGRFAWPVAGGYISQYFHYGHYAIDIAADRGTPVKAAAAGTVIFAGWKNNGGGYQVWISHGSNLYTTYNHMSSISVGRGQHVGRGQQVGRVGMTGNATGPHLHFEVWRGPVWNGGVRVNPLIYL